METIETEITNVQPLTVGNNRYYMIESENWSTVLYYLELKSDKLNHTTKLIKTE